MYGDGNSMVITNCTFGKLDSTTGAISEGNTASSGGAVFIQNNCSLTIDDSRFYGNTAQYGGAMAAYQSVTVTDSVFLANTAANSGGSAGAGGAVYFKTQGTSVFTNCSFGDPADRTKGNSSVWGGALLVEDSGVTVTLKNCGFYDSTATGHTGAILIKDAAVVNVEGCTFENNNGNGGGAINLENNKANVLTLKDVVFTGTGDARKVAAGYSAADISISGKVVADIYYTNADVLNVTGALASGSDVTVDWAVGKEPATAISFADAATLTASKDYISLGATQKGAGKYLSYSDTTATLAAGKTVATDANLKEAVEGASNGDILILLGDSYSVTESMKIGGKELTLLSAGDNTTLTVASGVSPFTLTSGDVLTLENLTVGGADGALAAQIVVPANATLNLKDSTLQYMKGAVKVNTSGVLNAVGCVFANNSGAEYGSAVGNWGGTSYVADCVFDNNSASKSGGAILNYQGGALTVENSSFTNNYAANRGGAIAAWNTDSGPLSTTTIKNCVFGNPDDTAGMTDNNGNTAGSAGGAIDFNNKNITYTVEDSKFYFNSASYGGAICSGGDTAAEVSIKNSIFKGNSATVNGGAILHEGATTLTLDGCNFEGNSADSSGGAICHASDTASIIKNCVFGNAEDTTMCNEASYSGGAIDISKGSPTIQNCKFYYNSATYIGGAVRFGIKVATVDGCTFVGNKTTASVNNGTNKGSDVGGGAIMAQGTPTNLTIQNSTFESNTSAFGGGALKTNSGTINVKGCTFGNAEDNTQGNTAPKGGAIYHQGNTLYILDLDGTKSYFYTNKATDGDGGAIYAGNVMTVTNAVFTGNMATGNGGAISAVNTVTIDGSEFAKNECNGEGAGINLPTGKTLNISNCVFTGNVTHKAAGNSNYGYGDIRVADSSDGNGVFVSGKFVGKIWMNQEDYINITGALTSDSNLVIDWRVGQIRESTTGVAIKFASQEIMEQSQAQIHIGEDASTTENYAFHYATSAPWQAIFVTKP